MTPEPPIRAGSPIEALDDYERWLAWKWEERTDPKTGEVKLTKPPYSRNGLPVSVKNPAGWMSKTEAASVPNMDGVGFSLFQHPNLAAFDLDHCRERETGEITNWARQIVEMAGSYTEITPSNEGLRVIGVVPEGTPETQFIVNMDAGDPAQKVEVYVHPARYVTVSGEMWEELPTAHKSLNDVSVVLEHMMTLKPRAAGEKNSEGSEAPDPDLTALPLWLQTLIRDGAPKGERSQAMYKVVANLRRLGFVAAQISQILRRHKSGIGAKCFEGGKDDTDRHVTLILRKVDDEAAKERAQGKGNPPPPEGAEEPNLAFLNVTYCVVEEGGKVRVLTFKQIDVGCGRQRAMAVYLTFNDFQNLYANQRVDWTDKDGKEKSAPLGRYWLSHRERRTFRHVVFRPGEPREIGDRLNLWRGWGVEPVQGRWPLMQKHIGEVLANGDEIAETYIRRWLAWCVQNPDLPAETALVFRGGRGSGKGTLGNAMGRIFGQHGLHISSATQLAGRFNAHLRDCSFLFADEAYWPGDKAAEGNLKRLITEPTLAIEGKGRDVVTAPNMSHVMMASNENWIVPAGENERRFAVFDVAADHMQDQSWFKPLYAELANGGLEAMLYDLIHMDLEGWHPRQIIHTPALVSQQARTLEPEDEWWVRMLDDGVIPGSDPKAPYTAIAGDFEYLEETGGTYNDGTPIERVRKHLGLYSRVRASSPRLRTRSDQFLSSFLKERGCSNEARICRRRGWTFPKLSDARAAWAARFPGWPWRNPELTTDWQPEEASDA